MDIFKGAHPDAVYHALFCGDVYIWFYFGVPPLRNLYVRLWPV